MGRILNRPAPTWQTQKLLLAKEIIYELKLINEKLEKLVVFKFSKYKRKTD
jgi:hypothetical protein